MSKIFKVLMIVSLCLGGGLSSSAYGQKRSPKRLPPPPQYAAIVIDAQSGRVWHEENADAKTHPASLTKMMTLYLLFEALEQKKLKLSSRMKISAQAVNQIPSKLGLRVGKTLRVQDAMLGLITKSANDAAVVIAEHLGGSVAQFAQIMTRKAQALGMNHTIFKNPNGVPNKDQITTARDMAILSRTLYQRFPAYCRYFNTRNFIYNGQIHKNHNHLLGQVPGVDGIKTGYIAASGFNLAASAKRNGVRVIVVVMGGKSSASRDVRVAELLEQGFYLLAKGSPKHNGKEVYLASEEKQPRSPKAQKAKITSSPQNEKPQQLTAALDTSRASYKRQILGKSVFSEAHAADYQPKESIPRDWLIQVGAFKRAKQANTRVQEILKTSKLKSEGAKPSVAATNGRRKLFQARVINLTQQQAQKTCQSLKQKGSACLAMRNLSHRLNYGF